jgi:hypothetical protein
VDNELRLVKLLFTLTFIRESRLPPFAGNTIRGALGQSLCDNCGSAYNSLFKVTSGESVPNPFVIAAPYPSRGVYMPGDTLEFSLTLLGTACDYEDDVIDAAKLMCKGMLSGAGLSKAECEYARNWSDAGAESIMPCGAVTLDFIAPTEILSGKEPVYAPDFATLMGSLFGRIAGIIDNYGESEFTVPYALIAKKPLIIAEYDLKQVRINSNKQPINGFVGTIRYSGDVTRYLPYIDLGSQIHIGKKTTRSCGEYYFELEGLTR